MVLKGVRYFEVGSCAEGDPVLGTSLSPVFRNRKG